MKIANWLNQSAKELIRKVDILDLVFVFACTSIAALGIYFVAQIP